MRSTKEAIEIAYKKLKASVFFDKSQLVLRNRIVLFEAENDIENKLEYICEMLVNADDKSWSDWKNQQLDTIRTLLLPKKIVNNTCNGEIIYNSVDSEICIDKPQQYFDMSVEGHILGILWVLVIGIYLDKDMVDNSFGNRLRKSISEETYDYTYSPYLFEPYFDQYVSWRDQALDSAKKWLNASKDVLILTLDFQSFFYSVDITIDDFESLWDRIEKSEFNKRLNEFVYDTIVKYSKIFGNLFDDRNILPIGYYPSNILANWKLDIFDKEIINRWNPTYYGRYVDDIIIVDKIEKGNKLYKKAISGTLSKMDIIQHYLIKCNAKKDQDCFDLQLRALFLDLQYVEQQKANNTPKSTAAKSKSSEEGVISYVINPRLFPYGKSMIKIQNKKLNAFYFRAGATKALIDCFQSDIGRNVSEFNLLPDAGEEININDYRNIYKLDRSESVNKLHGVKSIAIDKFEISKFLGKQLRLTSLIHDNNTKLFDHDLMEIFDFANLIEFYSSWEKLFHILIIKSRFDTFLNLVEKIGKAISLVTYNENQGNIDFPFTGSLCDFKRDLAEILFSAICRATSLSWGPKMKGTLNEVAERIIKHNGFVRDMDFSYNNITKYRSLYYATSMIDKYSIPIVIEFIKAIVPVDNLSDESEFNFFSLNHLSRISSQFSIKYLIDGACSNHYIFTPFMITPQELSFSLIALGLYCKNSNDNDGRSPQKGLTPNDIVHQTEVLYSILNYNICYTDESKYALKQVMCKPFIAKSDRTTSKPCYVTRIADSKKTKLRIAVANVEVSEKDFISVLLNKPNRSYGRYNDIAKLMNRAIKEKVDLIVFPECYIPFEMILPLARSCAKNQIALITGVEHVKVSNHVYNMTAIILPYQQDQFKYSHISMHYKVHFSPEEKRVIHGYRDKCMEGDFYNLFSWNDIWFPVYCCFELASIIERAQFQSIADLVVAVEWNKDINYFGSIIDSLSRDLHCYCIQVNSSNYGDSRISQPAKTEKKDLVKTKGGINKTILVGEVDIDKLRKFQFKEYELQKDDEESFKATPPQFDIGALDYKIKGKLWDYLTSD